MDHARMPSGGFRYGRTRTKEIHLEELTLDFFLEQYDKNEFGYLQGGFRSNGDRCPAAAVTDGFGEKCGGEFDAVSFPSYAYLVGLAHGSDGDPYDPEQPEDCPDSEWVEEHYPVAYDMGYRIRKAMEARGIEVKRVGQKEVIS